MKLIRRVNKSGEKTGDCVWNGDVEMEMGQNENMLG